MKRTAAVAFAMLAALAALSACGRKAPLRAPSDAKPLPTPERAPEPDEGRGEEREETIEDETPEEDA